MRKTVILFIFAFIALTAFSANAANVDNALIDKIQKNYEIMKGFEGEFEQSLTHKESGAKEKRTGKLKFKKPFLVSWVTDKPNEETLVINKSEIWDYIPDEEVAYKYSPELVKDSKNIIQVLTGQAKLTTDFDVKTLSPQNGLVRLQLFPDEPTMQMVDAMIWVDPEKALIRRVQINDFYGNSNDVTLKNLKENANIPDSSFKFSPPKGVEIEDRVQSGLQDRQLFK